MTYQKLDVDKLRDAVQGDIELFAAVQESVERSINQMGVENFEKCSFFISNYHKQNSEIKKAA